MIHQKGKVTIKIIKIRVIWFISRLSWIFISTLVSVSKHLIREIIQLILFRNDINFLAVMAYQHTETNSSIGYRKKLFKGKTELLYFIEVFTTIVGCVKCERFILKYMRILGEILKEQDQRVNHNLHIANTLTKHVHETTGKRLNVIEVSALWFIMTKWNLNNLAKSFSAGSVVMEKERKNFFPNCCEEITYITNHILRNLRIYRMK